MTEEVWPGIVTAETIEVRFAFAGKVDKVYKRRGDQVSKGELLATLDKTMPQTELSRQLAEYEKARAEWEIFTKNNPTITNDLQKYAKIIEQSRLDSAVKDVEIAKMKLDQTELKSPVSGWIKGNGGNRPGINATPASNGFEILDAQTLCLEVELSPDKAANWTKLIKAEVRIGGRIYAGQATMPLQEGKKLAARILIPDSTDLVPGQSGEAAISF